MNRASGLPPQNVLDFAACKGLDPDLFFPERGGPTKQAKAVCATCPVQAACLDWAIATRQTFGIWGGTSERERRRLRAGLPLEPRRTAPSPAPRKATAPREATDPATKAPYICRAGHLVDGDNVYLFPDGSRRACLACRRAAARASAARRRARRKAELAAIRAARAGEGATVAVCPHCAWAYGHSPHCQEAS